MRALGWQRDTVQHMRALPSRRGGVRARDRASLPGLGHHPAGVRVPGSDGGAVRRSALGDVGRNGPERGHLDHSRRAHEGERDHRVSLSGRSRSCTTHRDRAIATSLLFRSLRGKPLSNMTLSKLINELGIPAVPHGFRSSFRDWAAERTSTPRDVVEAALAHTVQNPTEAAYARSDPFDRRRRLMDDWAACPDGARRAEDSSRR